MIAIPIEPRTLPVITLLNDGVEPQIEEGGTFFIVGDEEIPNTIITLEEFKILYPGSQTALLPATISAKDQP